MAHFRQIFELARLLKQSRQMKLLGSQDLGSQCSLVVSVLDCQPTNPGSSPVMAVMLSPSPNADGGFLRALRFPPPLKKESQ